MNLKMPCSNHLLGRTDYVPHVFILGSSIIVETMIRVTLNSNLSLNSVLFFLID
jgi:hypothetical protein